MSSSFGSSQCDCQCQNCLQLLSHAQPDPERCDHVTQRCCLSPIATPATLAARQRHVQRCLHQAQAWKRSAGNTDLAVARKFGLAEIDCIAPCNPMYCEQHCISCNLKLAKHKYAQKALCKVALFPTATGKQGPILSTLHGLPADKHQQCRELRWHSKACLAPYQAMAGGGL